MTKQLTGSIFAAAILLPALAGSSAFASSHAGAARGHAGRRPATLMQSARRSHRKRGAVVRHQGSQSADAVSTAVLLGDTAVESQADLLRAGRAEAFRLPAGASGIARAAHIYIDLANAASTLIVGLYTDVNGHPGSLLSTGAAPAPQSGSWNTVSIVPTELVAGRAYWLALLGKGGTLRYRDRSRGRCPSETSGQRALGALPASWRTGTSYGACPASAFVSAQDSVAALDPISPIGASSALQTPSALEAPATLAAVAPVTPSPAGEPEEPALAPQEPPSSPPSAPVNSTQPAIAGGATAGQTLSASSGTWTGAPTSYAYQWQDCDSLGSGCANVGGATSSSYTLAGGDIAHTVRVVVTASNAGGSTSASSAPTAIVLPVLTAPVNVLPPSVSGSAVEGETLSATTGSWLGSPTSYAYQWQVCNGAGGSCANIAAATASAHVLSAGDVGHTIRVVVTASNAAGSTPASSSATGQVAAGTSGGAPEPACTVETESAATAKADLAIAGEVVCLKESGSPYSSMSITSGPSTSNATLVSAPGKHVVVKGVTIAANHITVQGLRIEGGINVGTGNSTAYNHDLIAWNDISNSSGDGVGVFARVEGPVAEFIDIEHNKIHNTSLTTEGDAVHAQGWANLTIRANDIYEISEEACKGACHDDVFQTYNAGFKTAHDLVFEKNYVHDNDTEGILLKDGDTAPNATIADNLMVRDERWGGIAGVWVDDCTHGLVIEKNTLTEGNNIQPLSSSCVEPSAVIKQNVFGRVKLGGESASGVYLLSSERNVFGEGPTGLYKTGAADETKSLLGSTTYKCSPGCKAGNDDYRLATNPKGAGIDWSPSEQSWGPNH
jgi:Right handed beta helix region